MKCTNCGAKLKVGCVYCSVCGQEAQIVPDYNLEEDYLKSLLVEKNKTKKTSHKKKDSMQKSSTNKSPKKGIIIALIVLILLVAAGLGFLLFKSYSYDGRLKKAEASYTQKDYEKAILYAKQAMEKDDKQVTAYVLLAKCYVAQKDMTQAEELLEQAVQLKKSNEQAYELLIEIYAKKEDYTAIQTLYAATTQENFKKLFKEYILDAPEIKPGSGSYTDYPEIVIRTDEKADIYYTTDGSEPEKNGILYEEPFFIEEEGNITLRAVCKDSRGIYSNEAVQNYNIQLDVPDLPTAFPESGTYQQPTPITIEVPDNCTAYYAWNGVADVNAALYTGPFEMIQGNNVLSIILVHENGQTSGVQKYNYIFMP